MFCSKSENRQIEDIQKRILRSIYKEENGTFNHLIEKYKELSIHERNVQSLMLLIYRKINNLSPELIAESFKKKTQNIHCVLNPLFSYRKHVKQPDLVQTQLFSRVAYCGTVSRICIRRLKLKQPSKKRLRNGNQRSAHAQFVNKFVAVRSYVNDMLIYLLYFLWFIIII